MASAPASTSSPPAARPRRRSHDGYYLVTHVVPGGRIAVNLAPAYLRKVRKEGPPYNLPIAAALLALNGQMLCKLDGALPVGELSSGGSVQHREWRPSHRLYDIKGYIARE